MRNYRVDVHVQTYGFTGLGSKTALTSLKGLICFIFFFDLLRKNTGSVDFKPKKSEAIFTLGYDEKLIHRLEEWLKLTKIVFAFLRSQSFFFDTCQTL